MKSLEITSTDPADEHVKTVYAHYGLALYLAQVLEHGLANALVYLDLIPNKARTVPTKEEWAAEFDSFMGRNFKKTLGGLVHSLRDVTSVPPGLEEKLTQALRHRNWLTHHFFRERAHEFMAALGRDGMIRELEDAQQLFRTADDLLGLTIKPIREKYSFTDENLEKFFTDYVSQIDHDL